MGSCTQTMRHISNEMAVDNPSRVTLSGLLCQPLHLLANVNSQWDAGTDRPLRLPDQKTRASNVSAGCVC